MIDLKRTFSTSHCPPLPQGFPPFPKCRPLLSRVFFSHVEISSALVGSVSSPPLLMPEEDSPCASACMVPRRPRPATSFDSGAIFLYPSLAPFLSCQFSQVKKAPVHLPPLTLQLNSSHTPPDAVCAASASFALMSCPIVPCAVLLSRPPVCCVEVLPLSCYPSPHRPSS